MEETHLLKEVQTQLQCKTEEEVKIFFERPGRMKRLLFLPALRTGDYLGKTEYLLIPWVEPRHVGNDEIEKFGFMNVKRRGRSIESVQEI